MISKEKLRLKLNLKVEVHTIAQNSLFWVAFVFTHVKAERIVSVSCLPF